MLAGQWHRPFAPGVASGRIGRAGTRIIAMLDETKFSDPEIDEGMRMPSGKVFLALAALGLLLLALAAFSSGRVTPAPQRGPAAANAFYAAPGPARKLDQDALPR
jgi:hypothetical protein